jgi:hypothetical protein
MYSNSDMSIFLVHLTRHARLTAVARHRSEPRRHLTFLSQYHYLRSTDPPGYIPDFPSQRKGVKHEGDHKYKGLSRITRTFNAKGKLIKILSRSQLYGDMEQRQYIGCIKYGSIHITVVKNLNC